MAMILSLKTYPAFDVGDGSNACRHNSVLVGRVDFVKLRHVDNASHPGYTVQEQVITGRLGQNMAW